MYLTDQFPIKVYNDDKFLRQGGSI
ncbi:unnamed protein product [Calypogeia fissa]